MTQTNAREALTKAYKKVTENYPELKKNPKVRGMMSLILKTLSNPPQSEKDDENVERCESWEDVEEMTKQAVRLYTPEEMEEIKEDLEKFFLEVVNKATQINPVYVSPPSYE